MNTMSVPQTDLLHRSPDMSHLHIAEMRHIFNDGMVQINCGQLDCNFAANVCIEIFHNFVLAIMWALEDGGNGRCNHLDALHFAFIEHLIVQAYDVVQTASLHNIGSANVDDKFLGVIAHFADKRTSLVNS